MSQSECLEVLGSMPDKYMSSRDIWNGIKQKYSLGTVQKNLQRLKRTGFIEFKYDKYIGVYLYRLKTSII